MQSKMAQYFSIFNTAIAMSTTIENNVTKSNLYYQIKRYFK